MGAPASDVRALVGPNHKCPPTSHSPGVSTVQCALVASHTHTHQHQSVSVAAPSHPGFPHPLRPPSQRSDMDCPKTESGEDAVACPPDDSLVEIFSRLHAKPLFRFKCVSKDWCGLIADRLRCRKFPQTLEGFFAGGGSVENYGAFIGLLGRPAPLVDPSFSFLTKSPEIEKIVLLGSCNGLVLFGHGWVVSDVFYLLGYIVCNPAIEEWVSVASSGYAPEAWNHTYLIFDPAISPQFQLIQFEFGYLYDLQKVHIFSSVTGAWRLGLEVPPCLTVVGAGRCPFNGMLHVGGCKQRHLPSENQPHLPSEDKHMILAISGEGRPFRTLHWPQNDRGDLVFIGQSQGHLHCLSGCKIEDQMNELSIWVLEDYNAEKWVLRDNVSLSQLFKRTRGCYIVDWMVVGIHPDRGLVFFVEFWNHKLISYDMDKKEVCALCCLHGSCRHISPYVPYFAESAALAKKH